MRKLGHLVIIGLLLSTPITFFISNVNAAAARIIGVIRDVNQADATVTIAARDGGVTLKVDDRTEITRNGEAARLSDLQITDKAQARYDSESLVARKLDAVGGEEVRFERIEGTIAGIDSSARSLTIAPLREGRPVTLHITQDSYITVDGRPASLGDLAQGYSAGAMYDPESLNAVRIQAESHVEIRGVVRDVNAGLGVLTIATGTGGRSVTLNAPAGTPVSLNDRPASLEDLHPGYEVAASYVAVTLTAVRISANSRAEIQGVIRAVDLDGSTLTISPLVDGAAVQVHVTNSTIVTLDGERSGLDKLAAGMPAQVAFNLGSFDAVSIAARSGGGAECTVVGVAGTVANVDAEGGHLTIHPAEGANDVTVNATNRTEITLNGRPVRLSELRQGMRVEARFCRESHNALAIAAHSEEGGGGCVLTGVSGSIARIDLDGGHLVITVANTPETSFLILNVVERTEISLNGRPARLSDLRPGMRVEARFCRETLDATVIAAGRNVQ